MNDKRIQRLEDIRVFLAGTTEMGFSIPDQEERRRWLEQTLGRSDYRTPGRTDRGVVLRYLERVSGYSCQTVTRLAAQYQASGKPRRQQRILVGFPRSYTDQDTRRLAELDELYGTPFGAAAKKPCEYMYPTHGDRRYEALSRSLVSHLYNLRQANGYQRRHRHFEKTHPLSFRKQSGEFSEIEPGSFLALFLTATIRNPSYSDPRDLDCVMHHKVINDPGDAPRRRPL